MVSTMYICMVLDDRKCLLSIIEAEVANGNGEKKRGNQCARFNFIEMLYCMSLIVFIRFDKLTRISGWRMHRHTLTRP